jgi:hypothetical protein
VKALPERGEAARLTKGTTTLGTRVGGRQTWHNTPQGPQEAAPWPRIHPNHPTRTAEDATSFAIEIPTRQARKQGCTRRRQLDTRLTGHRTARGPHGADRGPTRGGSRGWRYVGAFYGQYRASHDPAPRLRGGQGPNLDESPTKARGFSLQRSHTTPASRPGQRGSLRSNALAPGGFYTP